VLPLLLSVLAVPAVLPVPGVAALPLGAVVLDELDDVVGTGASSRLVQAPRETAATRARAAHEMSGEYIRKLLEMV